MSVSLGRAAAFTGIGGVMGGMFAGGLVNDHADSKQKLIGLGIGTAMLGVGLKFPSVASSWALVGAGILGGSAASLIVGAGQEHAEQGANALRP